MTTIALPLPREGQCRRKGRELRNVVIATSRSAQFIHQPGAQMRLSPIAHYPVAGDDGVLEQATFIPLLYARRISGVSRFGAQLG